MRPGKRYHYERPPGNWVPVEFVSRLELPPQELPLSDAEGDKSVLVRVVEGPSKGICFLVDARLLRLPPDG